MDGVIQYLNTDLDLISPIDLTALAAAFEAMGVYALSVTRGEQDSLWHATFETNPSHAEPESSITAMLNVIESFPPPHRATWNQCTLREFNIGYDCGLEPWAFNQGLSTGLLGRMAACGTSLRITLYPDRDEDAAAPRQSTETNGA